MRRPEGRVTWAPSRVSARTGDPATGEFGDRPRWIRSSGVCPDNLSAGVNVRLHFRWDPKPR